MVKGRSNYNISFIGEKDSINNLIQDYLLKNNFYKPEENPDNIYLCDEKKRGFKYIITTGMINISAWINDEEDGEITIENNALKSECNEYKKSLEVLFNDINILNNSFYKKVTNPNTQEKNEPISLNETLSNASIWIAILGMALVFFHQKTGLFISVINIFVGIYAILNNKKKKGIATLIIALIAIGVVILFKTLNINFPN